jgi:hypothetical protein
MGLSRKSTKGKKKIESESLTSYSIPESDFNRPISTIARISKGLYSSKLKLVFVAK